jgi:hypothetical protein
MGISSHFGMVPQPVSVEVGSRFLETGFTGHRELVKVLTIPWFLQVQVFREGGGGGGKSNKQELLVILKQCAFLRRKKKDPLGRLVKVRTSVGQILGI